MKRLWQTFSLSPLLMHHVMPRDASAASSHITIQHTSQEGKEEEAGERRTSTRGRQTERWPPLIEGRRRCYWLASYSCPQPGGGAARGACGQGIAAMHRAEPEGKKEEECLITI